MTPDVKEIPKTYGLAVTRHALHFEFGIAVAPAVKKQVGRTPIRIHIAVHVVWLAYWRNTKGGSKKISVL